ncbi:YlxM family DNA-binding protein [Haploplasma modicum]|jgi:uncharacterized protein|uniref:YlxM family DNA-binding protein n=1 Tax=Haploplasma modicum TaxID=2150 RepID=UPI000555C0A3|nr:hypothetical protein [Haploplasma modicum]MCR1808728.1 DNA-binding protein [Haploplasma modicum]
MEKLVKTELLNELFETYKDLFTEKQIEYFKYYYELDYSYQEIGEMFNVSRNAIFDSLKKVEDSLYMYEEKLKIVEKRNLRKEYLDCYLKTNDKVYLDKLKGMDE